MVDYFPTTPTDYPHPLDVFCFQYGRLFVLLSFLPWIACLSVLSLVPVTFFPPPLSTPSCYLPLQCLGSPPQLPPRNGFSKMGLFARLITDQLSFRLKGLCFPSASPCSSGAASFPPPHFFFFGVILSAFPVEFFRALWKASPLPHLFRGAGRVLIPSFWTWFSFFMEWD